MDYGAKYADEAIKEINKRLRSTYRTAQKELKEKLADFNRKFAQKNEEKKRQLESGKITKQQYKDWLTGQVFMRTQWENNIKQVNRVLLDANRQAINIINNRRLDVFAENYNYNSFRAEKLFQGQNGLGISFDLYNTQSVARLIADDPQILPEWKIDEEKDYDWNYKKVNNIVQQGIIQGEGVREITDRLCRDLSTMNENKMRIFARTAMTGAQNAGRQRQMEDAADMGLKVHKQWFATLDARTRDAHRVLDGQEVQYNEPFDSNLGEIDYPGDPSADPANVYNCRCTMVTIYPEYENRSAHNWREDEEIDGQTYEEWKKGKAKRESDSETIKEKIDYSQTIAGVKRGKPMTHEQADSGRVNPHYGERQSYGINCQSCVVAYEARRRGYDIEVVPNDAKHPMCRTLSLDTLLAWKNKDGSKADFELGTKWTLSSKWSGDKPTAKRFEKMLWKSLDSSGRYNLEFKWRGVNSGHIVTLRKDEDKLVIYDPQSNRTYSGKDVSDYLDRIAYTRKFYGRTYYEYPCVTRVDDKEFNYDVVNQIMKRVEK